MNEIAAELMSWVNVTDLGSPIIAAILFVLVLVLRLPRFNRRVAALLDPVVRWWTRGALTDEVQSRERMILVRRVRDLDIIEAYLVELRRWVVAAQLLANEHSLTLPEPPTFPEFKTRWLREHPDYDPLDDLD